MCIRDSPCIIIIIIIVIGQCYASVDLTRKYSFSVFAFKVHWLLNIRRYMNIQNIFYNDYIIKYVSSSVCLKEGATVSFFYEMALSLGTHDTVQLLARCNKSISYPDVM